MHKAENKTGVFLITTPSADGYVVEEFYGIVTATAVIGANFVKDYFAELTDKFGGRSRGFENAVKGVMDAALLSLAEEAKERGANAVIGVEMDVAPVGPNNTMFMATVTGTAVGLNRNREALKALEAGD